MLILFRIPCSANSHPQSRAYEMVQVRSQNIFEELEESRLNINEKREYLELEFRSATPQHSIPTRKINCFGQYQETTLTKEEIDSLRKERAHKVELKLKQLQQASEKRKFDRLYVALKKNITATYTKALISVTVRIRK